MNDPRGHGLGEKPANWPADKPWPPPAGPWPHPNPTPDYKG